MQRNVTQEIQSDNRIPSDSNTRDPIGFFDPGSDLYKLVWNKSHSKEQLIKDLNEQIENLKGEIDAHIMEESAISKSIKESKEKIGKGKKHKILDVFLFLEALQQQLP